MDKTGVKLRFFCRSNGSNSKRKSKGKLGHVVQINTRLPLVVNVTINLSYIKLIL